MSVTAVITNAGVGKITASSNQGIQLNITGAVFGSTNISSDQNVLAALTALPNQVFQIDNSVITYSRIDTNNVLFRIRLGNDIGNFQVGSFGLLSDTTLVTATSLDIVENKSKSDGTITNVGNIRFYETIININNFANIANLSILISNDSSLPEVDNETALPPANSSPFPVYFVHNWLAYHKKPALASRYNNQWYFYPAFEGSNQALFDPNVVPGDAVYFNTSVNRFSLAVANVVTKAPVALCGQLYTVINHGGIYVANSPIYSPGVNYFVDPNNPGKLTTNYNSFHVGYAMAADTLILNNFLDINKVVGYNFTLLGDSSGANSYITRLDGAIDEKIYAVHHLGNLLSYQLKNDTASSGNEYFKVSRSGYTVNYVELLTATTNVSVTPSAIGLNSTNATFTIGNNNAIYAVANGPAGTNYLSKFTLNYNNYVASVTNGIQNVTLTLDASPAFTINNGPTYLQVTSSGFSVGRNGVPYYFLSEYLNGSYVNSQHAQYNDIISDIDTRIYGNIIGNTDSTGATPATPNQFSPFVLNSEFYNRITGFTTGVLQRFPNGLKIIVGTSITTTGKQDYVAFPEAFTKFVSVVANEAGAGGWQNYNNVPNSVSPTMYGTDDAGLGGFYISAARVVTGTTPTTSIFGGQCAFKYIAIGI